jgi:hypothetical protein
LFILFLGMQRKLLLSPTSLMKDFRVLGFRALPMQPSFTRVAMIRRISVVKCLSAADGTTSRQAASSSSKISSARISVTPPAFAK